MNQYAWTTDSSNQSDCGMCNLATNLVNTDTYILSKKIAYRYKNQLVVMETGPIVWLLL